MKSQKQANGTLREELERVRLELSEMQTHAARADLVRETTGDPGLTIGCDVGPLEESPPSKERIM